MCYSGHVGRPIHDPAMKPRENLTLEEYRNGKDTAIMHFYEKLLKLKDTMNTSYATKLAQGRHEFLKVYFGSVLSRMGCQAVVVDYIHAKRDKL